MSADTDKPAAVEQPTYGGWRPWHPKGIQVWLPLPGDCVLAFAEVERALAAGWLVQCPGMEEGEEKEMVGWVCKREIEGNRGVSPLVLLYPANEGTHYSFLTVYLDSPEEVAAFEYASKLKLDKLPLYVGDNKPERGKSRQVDQFIVPSAKPFGVVWKRNPKHDDKVAKETKAAGGIYKIPSRLFVRWADVRPAAEQPKTADTPADAAPDPKTIAEWDKWMDGDPRVDQVNDSLPTIKAIAHQPTRLAVFKRVRERMEAAGCPWNAERKCFEVGAPASGEPY